MKGCSSLGKLRLAGLCSFGNGRKRDLALMDVKDAVKLAAPRYVTRRCRRQFGAGCRRRYTPLAHARQTAAQFGEKQDQADDEFLRLRAFSRKSSMRSCAP